MKTARLLGLFTAALVLAGCASSRPPLTTAQSVDLPRFMGDWYVIAAIPTFIETEAYNAVESYALTDDDTVATTFSFLKGGFDGKQKTYRPTGFVRNDTGNAVWGMRFVWPIKAEYRVMYVDPAYTQTIIGRSKRDYAWIMARQPEIPEAELEALINILDEAGYDTDKIRRVPQRWEPQVATALK